MGGRVINVKLDGTETLNPWDLPAGETTPSKEKIAFLKNLTRHMIGDSPGSDNSLVDNLLSDAIARTYKRCAIRYSNPIPTFNDLREELAQWRDEERMQRTTMKPAWLQSNSADGREKEGSTPSYLTLTQPCDSIAIGFSSMSKD